MTFAPEYAARLHRGAFDWIHRCYALSRAHGSTLVEALAVPEISNNVRLADEILEAWLQAGWIVQDERPTPSGAQRFFGVGGRPPGKCVRETAHPIEYGYRPNLDSAPLWTFLGEPWDLDSMTIVEKMRLAVRV